MTDRSRMDLDLVRRVLADEPGAFDTFFSEHFDRLYRFALPRVGHDHAAAEDVVQATLIQAVRKLGSFRGEAALFTWLCALCRNAIVDERRRGDLPDGRTTLIDDQPEVRGMLDALAATVGDGALDTPLEHTQRAEVVSLVRAVLDHLPKRYGDALELRYMHGLPTREVGARLGVSEKAAESLLARARDAFHEGLSGIASLPDLLQES